MLRLLIITPESKKPPGLDESLTEYGMACSITTCNNGVWESIARQSPDMLLVEIDAPVPNPEIWKFINKLKQGTPSPVMALVPEQIIDSIDGHLGVADDFITSPYDTKELALRIKRLLNRSGNMENRELIKCDGLVIDLDTCEVTIEGKIVELTFKEYELLKLLARHRGRVYTRDALLNRVWGYDYYGGDRTVDVHIRRLRSKIEDAKHSFIETVRNIGYRFKKAP